MGLADGGGVHLGGRGAGPDHPPLALGAVELGQRHVGAGPRLEAVERLSAWAGVEVALPELNGAQRQRRMIDAGATPAEVFAEAVRETHATYVEEERVP